MSASSSREGLSGGVSSPPSSWSQAPKTFPKSSMVCSQLGRGADSSPARVQWKKMRVGGFNDFASVNCGLMRQFHLQCSPSRHAVISVPGYQTRPFDQDQGLRLSGLWGSQRYLQPGKDIALRLFFHYSSLQNIAKPRNRTRAIARVIGRFIARVLVRRFPNLLPGSPPSWT